MSATLADSTDCPARIAHLWPTPDQPLPVPERVALPAPADRERVQADAVFASILALQQLLTHPDAKVVLTAAGMILDLEKTRMRHGRAVSGTDPHFVGRAVPDVGPDVGHSPTYETIGRGEDELEAEPDEETVEHVRQHLQQQADAEGTGEVVSRERAYQIARKALDLIRDPDWKPDSCGRGEPPDPVP